MSFERQVSIVAIYRTPTTNEAQGVPKITNELPARYRSAKENKKKLKKSELLP